MLHNSLLIRDRLREANQDPLRRNRRRLHQSLAIDPAATTTGHEVRLDDTWSIVTHGDLPGLETARDDLADFLAACGVRTGEVDARQIVLAAMTDVPGVGYRRTVDADRVRIEARTTSGLWAGIVDLEQEIAHRRAPILALGETTRTPQWPVQIGQSPFGANYLVPDLSPEYISDDAFHLMAHYGLTGVTIYGDWLLYALSDRYPELTHPEYEQNIATLRDAAERAGLYGIRLQFVPVSPKLPADHPVFQREPALRGARIATGLRAGGTPIHNLCSTTPESLAFHAETFASLFREVPTLGGLTLIIGGESYYHCFMRPDRTDLPPGQKTNCPHCAGRSPETVVAGLLEATADAVHAVAPDASVLAWPYSAFVWSADPDQAELIRQLPEGVGLHTEIDKDAWAPKDGYEKLIWDYSVDFTGPSDRIVRQAEAVRQRNRPLFIKTETALGLECIQAPYVPALYRLGEKWRHVRQLAPDGVLQSWMFFGMWGSRAEEIGRWTNWHPELSLDDVLRRIAERDFGDQAEAALGAWRAMSDAAGHLPFIATYFHGPEFIGPCHPLLFSRDESVPELFTAALYYLQENEATFGSVAKEVRHALVTNELPDLASGHRMRVPEGQDAWAVAIRELDATVAASREAYALLSAAAKDAPSVPGTALGDELGLVEFLYRTWLTMLHTYRFLLARERRDGAVDAAARDAASDEMAQIARSELGNATAARHLFADHPWLNLQLRLDGDYPGSAAMLAEKITMLEAALVGCDADQAMGTASSPTISASRSASGEF